MVDCRQRPLPDVTHDDYHAMRKWHVGHDDFEGAGVADLPENREMFKIMGAERKAIHEAHPDWIIELPFLD